MLDDMAYDAVLEMLADTAISAKLAVGADEAVMA